MTARRHSFTMIELIISLAIFALLMVLLLTFINTTNRVWTLSETNQRMEDDKRIVLELIQRDLNTAVVSSMPGREIGFYVGDPVAGDNPDGLLFAMVGASNMDGNSDYRLCEISYYLKDGQLSRKLVAYNKTNGGVSLDWDFYGNAELSHPTWVFDDGIAEGDKTEPEVLIDEGISALDIRFFLKGKNKDAIAPDTVVFEYPALADFTLVLYDPSLRFASLAQRTASERPFTEKMELNRLSIYKEE